MIKLGLFQDSFECYRSHPAISKGGLDQFHKSPLKYKASLTLGREQTASMMLGEAIHCAALEPDKFKANYFNMPEGMRRGTKAFDELQKEHEGKISLNNTEWLTIDGIVGSLSQSTEAQELLRSATKEVSAYTLTQETHIPIKGRIDALNSTSNTIIDLKTTEDASLESFSSSIYRYRYHVQAAIYQDIIKELTGKRMAFKIIAIEKDAPYDFAIYEIDDLAIEEGRRSYQKEIVSYQKCLESDTWPGLPKTGQRITLPAYAFKKESL